MPWIVAGSLVVFILAIAFAKDATVRHARTWQKRVRRSMRPLIREAERVEAPVPMRRGEVKEVRSGYQAPTDGYRRTFLCCADPGRTFRLHLWTREEGADEPRGFQLVEGGDSGTLVNWRVNGHPAFTVSWFYRAGPSYMDEPTEYDAIDRRNAGAFLRGVKLLNLEPGLKSFLVQKLRDGMETPQGGSS
jgi:hypothetical protein